jgi:hypothetical protein
MVGAALLSAPPAGASPADDPTSRELLEKCNHGTDSCVFHPEGAPTVFRGAYRLAGGATNCTQDNIKRSVQWSATEHTTNNIGLEMTAGGGFGAAFSASFTTSFGHEWGWSSTKTDTVEAEIGPHRAINVSSAPMDQTIRGKYELRFPNRFRGHYIWYVNGVEVTGPADDAWDARVEPANAAC